MRRPTSCEASISSSVHAVAVELAPSLVAVGGVAAGGLRELLLVELAQLASDLGPDVVDLLVDLGLESALDDGVEVPVIHGITP